jgi:cellulose synthase/poly-beta-1,6-N-acetylglucosamine synthase-like glycosyltransferase
LLFWLAALVLVYTFALYPMLIAAWARWRPQPVRRAHWEPRVAFVVVMHNEAARVVPKLDTCLKQDYPAERLRVVIASDGSTDATNTLVREYPDARVALLAFAQRRGKAACLNDAVAACDEEVIVFTDARQQLNRGAVRSLVQMLADPRVGVVSGELMFASEGVKDFGQGVDAYWRYEKFIRKNEALVHSVPGATGALYALRRSAFRAIAPQTILDDVAIPMRACLDGLRVVFDDQAHAYDRASSVAAAERRRKVRTLAGNFQLMALMPRLLWPPSNPIFWQFLSHKVLRLAAPWAMAAMLATSAALAADSAFFRLALIAQLLFYGLPLIGLAVPRLRAWKPVRIVQAFIALNWFALLGFFEFLTNRRAHLWQSTQGQPTGGTRP